MNQRIKNLADVRHPAGLYVGPHAVLALILAGIIWTVLVATGIAVATHRYDAGYYQQRYAPDAPLVTHPAIPVTGSYLNPRHGGTRPKFLVPVVDQGNTKFCTGFVFSEAISYAQNRFLRRFDITYSPLYTYDIVSGARDIPTSISDYNATIGRYGEVRNRYWHFSNPARDSDLGPIPSRLSQRGRIRFDPFWVQWLWSGVNAGPGASNAIEHELAARRLVIVGMPFTNGMYDAAVTGYYDPRASETDLGGHYFALVRYEHWRWHNHVRGWVLARQTWGCGYGVAWNGTRNAHGCNGYVWVSERSLNRVSFGGAVEHQGIEPAAGGHGASYFPPHAPLHRAPGAPLHPTPYVPNTGGQGIPKVYGVVTYDTDIDISNAINQAAAYYGFSAPGFASLIGVESGWHQYAPHEGGYDCDYSAGLTQITVCTAAGLGVGDGSLSGSNIAYVFSYEQADAVRDIWFSARLIAQFKSLTCEDWPALYAVWNQGPGYGCGALAYTSPSNSVTINAMNVYYGWWQIIWAHHVTYATPPPPKPRPKPRPYSFPWSSWNSQCSRTHVGCHGIDQLVWANRHGGLTWPAGTFVRHPRIGGFERQRWFGPTRQRRYGFSRYDYRYATAYGLHTHVVKIVRHW